MDYAERTRLEQLGLSAAEAGIYLTLLRNGPLGASAIAAATDIQRTSVYPALSSLADKGLIEEGAGHRGRFSPLPPQTALPALIARQEESLLRRRALAQDLAETLEATAETNEVGADDFVQVLRDPRAGVDRFTRLELEAEESMDIFTKPPFFNRNENAPQLKAMNRGVRVRSIYERAAVDDPAVKPHLHKWLGGGEEGRIYDGVLPHKMAIFDSKVVLMPMIMPADQTRILIIRNAELAQSFSLAFQHVWERSEPLSLAVQKPDPAQSKTRSGVA